MKPLRRLRDFSLGKTSRMQTTDSTDTLLSIAMVPRGVKRAVSKRKSKATGVHKHDRQTIQRERCEAGKHFSEMMNECKLQGS